MLLRFRISGRVRRFFESNMRRDTVDVTVLILGIATDIFQTSTASAAAVRSQFERATETLNVCDNHFIHHQ